MKDDRTSWPTDVQMSKCSGQRRELRVSFQLMIHYSTGCIADLSKANYAKHACLSNAIPSGMLSKCWPHLLTTHADHVNHSLIDLKVKVLTLIDYMRFRLSQTPLDAINYRDYMCTVSQINMICILSTFNWCPIGIINANKLNLLEICNFEKSFKSAK